MSSYDLSSLGPADAVVALRSFPRRYHDALRPIDDDEHVDELATRAGPDGRSALDLVVDTIRTWTVQREALRQIRLADVPTVHAAVVDATQRHWEAPVRDTLDDALAQIADEATALADEVDRTSGGSWTRTATATGGASITALDVVRDAVRVGRDNLVAAERVLDSLRRR